MNNQTDLAIAARCRQLSQVISDFEFLGRKELFEPIFQMNGKTLAKYMTEEHVWKQRMIDSLGLVAEMRLGKFGFSRVEVVEHLLNGDLRQNWKVIDLMHADVARQDRKLLEAEDEARIHKYLRGNPRKILSVQHRLPFRHMTDQYLDAFYFKEQITLGFDESIKKAKIKIAEECRDDFLENYDPRKTDSVVAILSSGLQEIESLTGHAEFILPEAHVDIASSLRKDVIKEKHVDMRMIPDAAGRLPQDLAKWLAAAEVVVAVDDVFLMKVLSGGAIRVFYERGKTREMNRQLDEQLTLLKRVLNVSNEEDSQKEMADWLERLSAGAEREVEQHRVFGRRRHARLLRDDVKPPQKNKLPWRIQLHNGKWIDLPEL
jgi:hypothetical protein